MVLTQEGKEFIDKWALLFADNEFENITEETFRTFVNDAAQLREKGQYRAVLLEGPGFTAQAILGSEAIEPFILYAIKGTPDPNDPSGLAGTWNQSGLEEIVYLPGVSAKYFAPLGYVLDSTGVMQPVRVDVAAGTWALLATSGGGPSPRHDAYPVPRAGAQSVRLPGMTFVWQVGIRAANGLLNFLSYGTGYTFTAGMLTVLAAVGLASQGVLEITHNGTGVTTTAPATAVQLGANDVAMIGLLGQSNALSNANKAAFKYAPLDTIGGDAAEVFANVYMYRAATGQLEPLQDATNTRMAEDNSIPPPASFHTSDAGVWQNGNAAYGYTFETVTRCYFLARQFKATYPNGTLVIVQGAVGGVPRSRWVKSNNDLYTRFVNQVNSAKALITAQGKTPRLLALDCTQGEQDLDQNTSLATYDSEMRSMWTDLLADIGTAETQLIEYGIPDDGSKGSYVANPFNSLKATWASEDARRHYFAPDFVKEEEDRIHWNAPSQMYAGYQTFAVAFQKPFAFPADVAQVGPTLSYDAGTQTVTITPPSADWQRVEFYYQVGAYAPVQLINNWTVKLTATAPLGAFKCWARAVPGRAKSAVTANTTDWVVPSSGATSRPSGYAVWVPEKGNVVSTGGFGTTLSGRTLRHAAAAPDGPQNFAPADVLLDVIPANFVGIALQIDIPAIAKANSAVTIGVYVAGTTPTAGGVVGKYQDNTEFHLLYPGNSNQAIYYPNATVPVTGIATSIIFRVATAGAAADVYLADAQSNPIGPVKLAAVGMTQQLGIACFLHGNAGWDAGQDVSQASDVYFHSDFLIVAP